MVSALDDQQCPPPHDAESTKSANAQPEKINPDGVTINKNATEILQLASNSENKSPDLTSNCLRIEDLCREQSQWLGTLGAIKKSTEVVYPTLNRTEETLKHAPGYAVGSHALRIYGRYLLGHISSHWVGAATLCSPKKSANLTTLMAIQAPQSDTKHALVVTEFAPSATASDSILLLRNEECAGCSDCSLWVLVAFGYAQQLFELAIFPLGIAHVWTQNELRFPHLVQDFDAQLYRLYPLVGSVKHIPSWPKPTLQESKSHDKSWSIDNPSVLFATQKATGYAADWSPGWSIETTIPVPCGHPNGMPRAKILAKATTISAQTRPKTGCNAPQRTTPTPTKTTP